MKVRNAFILATVAVALLMVAAPAAAQTPAAKVVLIDGDRATTETAIGQQMRDRLNTAAAGWQERIDAAQQELNALAQQRQQQQLTLSAAALDQMTGQIEEKQVQVERLQADAQRAVERLQVETVEQMNAVLIPAIEAMAAEEGYDIVLDTRLTQTGGLLFYVATLDVTDAFIARVNAATDAGGQ